MKIVLLDRATLGADTPISVLNKFGSVDVYDHSSHDEAVQRSADANIIIINKLKITRDIIENAKDLRLICVFATGFDNIDITAARELGVGVCNVPGYSTESVVLFTVSTALALYSHLYEYNSFVKSGDYSISGAPNRLTPVYHNISGKTWGIVGYGNIGRAVASVAEALGARVIVYKRNPTPDAECVDIDTLCSESDIITLHCPLNDESRHLIDRRRISLMKPSVVIVNEARGAVTDEEAIANAVEEGRVAAFGCDVYSSEPFDTDHPFYRIKDRSNVILTPHAAWGSYEAREKCIEIIASNIESFIEGKMQNRVDK